MNRTAKHKAALQQVINWLEDGAPETTLSDDLILTGFRYTSFFFPDHDCGTTGCIAGAAVAFDFSNPSFSHVHDLEDEEVDLRAQEILGLTEDQAVLLFYPFNRDFREIMEITGEVFDEDGPMYPYKWVEDLKPTQIAKVLTHFNETGEINWEMVRP